MPNRDVNSKGKNHDNDTHKVTGHRFESRIIYNSSKNSTQSTNWRLDFYKCNNVTYAQVLKKGIKNKAMSKDQSHGHSIQTTDQVPNKVTSMFIQQNNVMNKISYTDQTNHRCNSSGYNKPQSKVRKLLANSSHVQCANRFALLSVDAVVSKTNSPSTMLALSLLLILCRHHLLVVQITMSLGVVQRQNVMPLFKVQLLLPKPNR